MPTPPPPLRVRLGSGAWGGGLGWGADWKGCVCVRACVGGWDPVFLRVCVGVCVCVRVGVGGATHR